MKRKIYLFITLFLSLFIFSDRVGAVNYLTCVYDGTGTYQSHYMFVQKGKWYAYSEGTVGVPSASDGYWTLLDVDEFQVESGAEFYLSDSNSVDRCPKYVYYKQELKSVWPIETYNKFILYDEQEYGLFGNPKYASLVEEIESAPDYEYLSPNANTFYSKYNEEYEKIVEQEEWIAKCAYGSEEDVYLYFNDDMYILINKDPNVSISILAFTFEELQTYFDSTYVCPTRLFTSINYCTDAFPPYTMSYYIHDYGYGPNECQSVEYTYNDKDSYVNLELPDDPIVVINDCYDLLGDELVDKINDIMKIIKIVVPILLIAFGTIDFTKAIFSGSEDDINKGRKTFFKRILAAVLVFIAPIFIKLVLSLANVVWNHISSDTCLIEIER